MAELSWCPWLQLILCYVHFFVGFQCLCFRSKLSQNPVWGWVTDAVMHGDFVLISLISQSDFSWPYPKISVLFHLQSQNLITTGCNEYNSSIWRRCTKRYWGVWICYMKALETSVPWCLKIKMSLRTNESSCCKIEGSGRHGICATLHKWSLTPC